MGKNMLSLFMEKLSSDDKLRSSVFAASETTILKLLRDNGFKDITQKEAVRLLVAAKTSMDTEGKLSEEAMEKISGSGDICCWGGRSPKM